MLPNVAPILRRLDRPLYVLWAAVCTLASARSFYGYMLKQTGGEWSAPLDDVFIHFDYARSTALGHPFEWTVGNGYSSGNTSLTYPFVLALGWFLGFVGRDMMRWAAIVAAMSVFGTLLASRRLFIEDERDDWGRLSSYLLPPAFLGIGALTWSLWSGMEVAFFLATWAIALVAWLRLEGSIRFQRRDLRRSSWLLGLAGALLVVTRPEAALTIAIFGIAAASRARSGRIGMLLRVGVLGVVLLAAQAIANRVFTGESSANGAIVKLALNNPFMTADEKWEDWLFNVRYAALRNLDYHFAHIEGDAMSALVDRWPKAPASFVYLARTAWWAGVVPLVLAVLPLVFGRTRRIALVLWAQIVGWIVLVAFNGQVRWQNERYVMPAVAWLMILAVLGVSVCFRRRAASSSPAPSEGWAPIVAVVVASAARLIAFTGVLGATGSLLTSWALVAVLAWALVSRSASVRFLVALVPRAVSRSVPARYRERVGRGLLPSMPMVLITGALVVQTIGVLTRPVGELPSFRVSWLLAFGCAAAFALLLRFRAFRIPLAMLLVLFAWDHQAPKMRDQKWFFGRASRNIRDQHLTLGKYLAETKPKRVLVGDAGAILYESDRPGLDIIGLGGYHALPFARASVHGLPATLELLERIPKEDRPDVLAIFPTWWGVLPVWFSDELLRRFPVEGNVICGGYEQNVYRANWSLLNTGDRMRWESRPRDGTWEGRQQEKPRTEIDVADLVSEKQNGYRFDQPQNGWTDMRILPDPADPQKDLFDAGRRIAVGKSEHFDARGLVLGKPFHVVVRIAQEAATKVRVRVEGADAGTMDLTRTNAWEEKAFEVDGRFTTRDTVRITLTTEGPGDFVDYHVWITQ